MGNLITLPKNDILDLIVQGKPEYQIAKELHFEMIDLVNALISDTEFAEQLQKARAIRAERWVGKVTGLIETESGSPIIYDKDDVPGAKLAIDTYKWLAKVDNPQRFGDKLDVDVKSINIHEIKGLSVSEAIEIIKNDPFAPKDGEVVDAVFSEIPTKRQREVDDENML
jgi:hypothetical protein